MPDNGIFCVLLVFWNAQRASKGEECIAQNQFARNIFHDFLFYMLICLYICTLSTHRSRLPLSLAYSFAFYSIARLLALQSEREAFCFFTYIGVIAFHVLKRSRVSSALSCMHIAICTAVEEEEKESTQRIAAACTNVMQMQCNRFNRLCVCVPVGAFTFSRLQFFTCNASSFIY